jgi:hypothetical protein
MSTFSTEINKYFIYVTATIQEPEKLTQYRDEVTGWTTGVKFPKGSRMGCFFFATLPRPDLGLTQPPIRRVPGAFTPG